MGPEPDLAKHRAAESLLSFWAEAGVDTVLSEAPVDRIAAGRVTPFRPLARGGAAAPVPAAPSPEISGALQEARRLATEAQDMAALKAAIADFDGCPVKFEGAARQAVFYRGALDAPLMVVGEGPGSEEDAKGEPFVGRAGRLLDKMLDAAGLTGRVFITNTIFWRPPGNRTPTPAEQMVCAPFLERAIQLAQPRILLLVGGASAKSMLKKSDGILSLRGRWFEWRSEDGSLEIPALPTLHPAFLLRQPAAKKRAWSDLLTLVERLDRGERPT